MTENRTRRQAFARSALTFVQVIGIVNLFADLTYEGARSVSGPFLGSLGASAAIVGTVAGLGELAGYSLRSVFGVLADKTRQYWLVTLVGYGINMLAVPALALAGNWPVAAALIVGERTGRAIRRPAMETMISYTGRNLGSGWAFGLNEAMDQTGATIGPLVVALVLFLKGGYRHSFAVLLIPALLSLGTLLVSRIIYPRPRQFESEGPEAHQASRFPHTYWLYVIAGALIAAGFTDFALIAFHFQRAHLAPVAVIPVLYAGAMAAGAVSALGFGRLLDRIGTRAALVAFFLSALFAPLTFYGGLVVAAIGMVLWGLGLGAQDSLLKAMLATIVPSERRSTAFGLFDTCFGIAWFAGSAAMGFLYDRALLGVVVCSVVLQLAALPFFQLAEHSRHAP